jgi:hypothetical protein
MEICIFENRGFHQRKCERDFHPPIHHQVVLLLGELEGGSPDKLELLNVHAHGNEHRLDHRLVVPDISI